MLKNMGYVYAVYLNRSFSKAAEELYISQPALSAAVKKVEEKIGLPIFDRSSNPVKLTKAGEYYIECIEKVMEIEKDMKGYFNSFLNNNNKTINVGGSSFFCAYTLPTIVQEFKREFPDYTVNLMEANADDLMKNLRSGIFDIIIDVEQRDPKIFGSFVWAEEQIVLAVPTHYEINNKLKNYRLTFEEVKSGKFMSEMYPRVSLSEFKNENFLLMKKGNDSYKRGLKMCRMAGFTPKVSMYLDQLLTSYYLACNGKGISFVRAGITRYIEKTNKLYFYKIDDVNSVRNILLYYNKSRPLSNVGTDFINFLYKHKPVGI
ncbi:LysR family transcriptional regulator [Ureibacillus manganicus]|uniref:HTH lysR-type domain-containing protein n=1 Tax=Ureibacillus manganicus DSM 26584 TaxID=1384049 RepID=A0A0A3IQM3_9BACL|nr:LysR family transcriptional regulator [Ureibacillus manganicus]KGR77127.1 hypothetical protein CD29_15635 [Ureibacillus manganicus DSM 26584]